MGHSKTKKKEINQNAQNANNNTQSNTVGNTAQQEQQEKADAAKQKEKEEQQKADAELKAEAAKREEELRKNAQQNYGNPETTELEPQDIIAKGIVGSDWVKKNREKYTGIEDEAFSLVFGLPNWGIESYLEERQSWQKQLNSLTGEPGWFYFKIFFKFNTRFGLLGDILGDCKGASNSAIMYLSTLRKAIYSREMIETRLVYLNRFVKTLSFISTKAPWFFKGIKGLDKCGNAYINDFTKEKSIEIECSEEAVDMRLTTLLDMYKFVAFDEINCKEILPENLRKFDMVVVLFHVPLRYWHTKSKINNTNFASKTLNDDNKNNLMSYKMYTFLNCEIDPASIGVMTPNNINNEKPFQLGKSSIKINYDRCYNHLVNEWSGDIFGADGSYSIRKMKDDKGNTYYTGGDFSNARIKHMRIAYEKLTQIANSDKVAKSSSLVDLTEELISNMMGEVADFNYIPDVNYSIGDKVYSGYLGPDRSKHTEPNSPKQKESEYFADKMKGVKGRAKKGENIGNLYNYEVGPGTVYFENKLKQLKGHGHHMSLYQYLIGPYSPALNRKESDYFREKMRILHDGGDVNNPGSKFRIVIPALYGFLSPFQEKYNQWLFNYKYDNALKKTATYNPYGWTGYSNRMFTRVPNTYLGKTTRNYLNGLFQSIKPKFLR